MGRRLERNHLDERGFRENAERYSSSQKGEGVREALEIITTAIEQYKPVAIYAGFSGGNDSRAITHLMMNNVPGCQVFHANTGIGIERTRQYVRDTCSMFGWPLTEIRAKEDCGQDYDEIVLKNGFPGAFSHRYMYIRLKERAIKLLVKRAKKGHSRRAHVLIATGVRHDESIIRMGYAGEEITKDGSLIWVNGIYWWPKSQRDEYNAKSGVPENPIAKELGLSGECGCGAYAQTGEFSRWKAIDPQFGERIEGLQERVLEKGFTWSWEGHPPEGGFNEAQGTLAVTTKQPPKVMPFCAGCVKSAIVQEELEGAA